MSKTEAANELLSHPEVNTAINLVRDGRFVIGPEDNQVGARVSEAEAFSHLNPETTYDNAFNKQGRSDREMFAFYACGRPALSYIEDARRKSIIVLKSFQVELEDDELSRPMTLKALLEDDELGLGFESAEWKEFFASLDGTRPGPAQVINLLKARFLAKATFSVTETEPDNSLAKIKVKTRKN